MIDPAILVLTTEGLATARRIQAAMPTSQIHGRSGRVEGTIDHSFTEATSTLRRLFRDGRPIIALCASGIVIRALAPLLNDKRTEPPVLAVAEDGSAVVPLLGGHGGGNRLAQRVAASLGVKPAITTAGDLRFGLALDDPPPGWRLGNPQDAKAFAAALLAGTPVRLAGSCPWLEAADLPFTEDAGLTLRATDRAEPGSAQALVYHPALLALGIGCARGADPAEVIQLAEQALADNELSSKALAAIFTIDVKEDEPALRATAAHFGVPLRLFDAASLEAESPRLANPSQRVFREVGCHGVAEGAALAGAGPDSRLIVPKRKSANATCALARAAEAIVALPGRAPGHLAVVGLGPGGDDWRTAQAQEQLDQATDLVGYQGYLDQLGNPSPGQVLHGFALGEEEARVRHALDLAARGRQVALVCSGDPGIYAMAALVFEQLERAGRADWRRVAVTVAPGVSALQAAAARIGAPLGHDFCAISLSDLLTPWAVIERRLRAAAEGDFVVALYNPVSQRRRQQLVAAVEILGAKRPPNTPVVLGRNLGRPGEAVTVIDLADLTPDKVDMLTLVLIGASETRRLARGDGGCWVYTPRGYAAKAPKKSEDAA